MDADETRLGLVARPLYEIVVVDDEETICHLLKRKLTEDNFQVRMISDGARAIEAIKERKPCLVVLDMNMPERNGLDILKDIKAVAPEVPVVMVSGDLDDEKRERAMALGACGFLPKPFEWNELRNIAYLCSFLKVRQRERGPAGDAGQEDKP